MQTDKNSTKVRKSAAVPTLAAAGNVSRRFQFDEMLELGTSISQARCLVDVLSELCLPGGDAEAGEDALNQIGPAKLWSTLSVLDAILAKIDERFHASAPISEGTERAEVGHLGARALADRARQIAEAVRP